jgi:molybdopterin converting factor small subunit
MKLKILAFGIAKDIVNGSSVEIELNEPYDSGNLRLQLESKFPRLKDVRSYLIAVNEEYVDGVQKLSSTDEIAIIPPVSGG